MLDLIYHVLKEDTDITGMVGTGDDARIYPYFREPDDATTYPAIYFEQVGSTTQHVQTSNTAVEGVAFDGFEISVSCVATTLADAWKLFHFVRTKMGQAHNVEKTLESNKWTLLDSVFDDVKVELIFEGDLAVAEGRFDVFTRYEYVTS